MPMIARLFAVALATLPCLAEAAPPTVQTYEDCMALVRRSPEPAFEAALAWRTLGGGQAADHCIASALNAMGQHAGAARRLEDLAQSLHGGAADKAEILGQAAQAWMLADEPDRAIQVLDAALNLDPTNAELFIDRAQAHAAKQAYQPALNDLNLALSLDPRDVDALVFRANARRYLGDLAGARTDAEAALRLDPGNPEGLLERGTLKRLGGDKAGARADWIRVLTEAPETAAARNAQHNIEMLDVRAGER